MSWLALNRGMSGNWRFCAGLDRLLQCAPGALVAASPGEHRGLWNSQPMH